MVCAAPKCLLCSMHKAHAEKPAHSAARVKAKEYFGSPRLHPSALHNFHNQEGSSSAPHPHASNCLYYSACARKRQQRLESKQLYCACVEFGNPCSSADDYDLKDVRTPRVHENRTWKVRYTWALRFLIT